MTLSAGRAWRAAPCERRHGCTWRRHKSQLQGWPRIGSPAVRLARLRVRYLNDDRSSTAGWLVPTAVDGLLLAGMATSFSLAVRYRNQYAHGDRPTLDPANAALSTGLWLTGGLVATRLVSWLVYGKTTVWQKDGASTAQARRR